MRSDEDRRPGSWCAGCAALLALAGCTGPRATPPHDAALPRALGATRDAAVPHDAAVPRDAAQAAAPRGPTRYEPRVLVGLARDRASVVECIGSYAQPDTWRYQRLDVATGAVLATWRHAALAAMPIETDNDDGSHRGALLDPRLRNPQLAEDIRHHAGVLLGLLNPLDERFAVAPDGAHAFLNVGDQVYLADADGRLVRRLSDRATYQPSVSPDGRRVAVSTIVGSLDGVVGNYMLHLAPATTGAPLTRVEGTRDVRRGDLWWSPDGALAYVAVGSELPRHGCLLVVNAAARRAVRTVGCVGADEDLAWVGMSPARTTAVLLGRHRTAGPRPDETFHWFRVADGASLGVHTSTQSASRPIAVDDDGTLYASYLNGAPSTWLAIMDPVAGTFRVSRTSVPTLDYGAVRLSPTTWLAASDRLETVDINALTFAPVAWPY